MALALLTAACGADGEDSAPATAATVETTSTAAPVGGPATTTAETVTTEPDADVPTTPPTTPTTPVAAAGAVTPVVACIDDRGAAFFGYTSTASVPVTIAVGAANRVTIPGGAAVTDQQPDVFVPGEHPVVFWTDALFTGAPTWTLTGSDGIERSATADDAAPRCPTGPTLDPPDDRVARVVGNVDRAGAGAAATITITVEGLPGESRCPAGPTWSPEPPAVMIEAHGRNATRHDGADRSTARFTIDDLTLVPMTGFDVVGFAAIDVWVDVDDRCTDASGVTARAWGASGSLRDLSQIGTKICFGATPHGYDDVDCSEGPVLATTGGMRLR